MFSMFYESMLSESPTIFKRPGEIEKILFAGYEDQMRVGLAMGKRAAERRAEYRTLLFGYPGTGKTIYAQALAYRLNDAGYNYSLLYVKCNSLIRLGKVDEILSHLNQIERYSEFTPLIVAFDELDTLAVSRDTTPTVYTSATGNMMNFLDRRKKSTLTFGIANYPNQLDTAVTDRFDYSLFFELPNKEVLIQILDHYKIPNPKEVVERLRLMSLASFITGRGIVKACQEVGERSNDLEKMARLLHANIGLPVPFDETRKYEFANRRFIDRSLATSEFWLLKHDERI